MPEVIRVIEWLVSEAQSLPVAVEVSGTKLSVSVASDIGSAAVGRPALYLRRPGSRLPAVTRAF